LTTATTKFDRNLLPSTAKTQDVTNFDLGNVSSTNQRNSIELDSGKDEAASTLPALKNLENKDYMKKYTNEVLLKAEENKAYKR
jgi:hypothetical protein